MWKLKKNMRLTPHIFYYRIIFIEIIARGALAEMKIYLLSLIT